MAIGGSYNNKGYGSNGVGRGRSYGLMLLIAFGAALLGVMVLHKLRERRIFNLLIKERDSELFSLNLLLQKERDYIKEVKGKNEEMKAKIYSLRTQKMELDRRLLEMQSTIDSLKDEQRTMEIAIEEKQNEVKMLRVQDQKDSEKENPQLVALVESLKQKEAEIEDLKHRLQYPESDPSNPQAKNITKAEEEGKSSSGEIARVEDEDGNKAGREHVENRGDDKDEGSKDENVSLRHKNEESKDENVSLSHNVVANSTGVISQNFAGKDVDGEEFRVEENGQLRKRKNSQVEGEANSGTDKGAMKMEIRDGFEKNNKRGSVSDTVVRGKRWRLIAKSRRLENNGKLSGVARTRNARFYRDDHGLLKRRVKRAASKGGVLLVEDNHQLEGRKSRDSSYEMPKKGGVFLNGDVMKESAKHGGDDELFDESGSRSEGISDEEYKEEIDESEF